MATIGLLGHEYDECLKRLKVHIEDRGHTARVVNLQHLPRVTRATVDLERIVHDGYDLLGMDCFFLKEMDIRDPFFHVRYSEELWGMLRERYLSFAGEEIDNILFVRNLLWILAERKPMINHPRVYDHRNQMPYHLTMLANRGFAVPRFVAGPAMGAALGCSGAIEEAGATNQSEGGDSGKGGAFNGPHDDIPLRLDEHRTWEVYTFPKGKERDILLRRGRRNGTVYKLIVVGGVSLDHAVAMPPGEDRGRCVAADELPAGIAETACRAANSLGASFAEVELEFGSDGEGATVQQVDSCPEFFMLEDDYRLSISEPLAEYLIAVGSQRA